MLNSSIYFLVLILIFVAALAKAEMTPMPNGTTPSLSMPAQLAMAMPACHGFGFLLQTGPARYSNRIPNGEESIEEKMFLEGPNLVHTREIRTTTHDLVYWQAPSHDECDVTYETTIRRERKSMPYLSGPCVWSALDTADLGRVDRTVSNLIEVGYFSPTLFFFSDTEVNSPSSGNLTGVGPERRSFGSASSRETTQHFWSGRRVEAKKTARPSANGIPGFNECVYSDSEKPSDDFRGDCAALETPRYSTYTQYYVNMTLEKFMSALGAFPGIDPVCRARVNLLYGY